VHLVLVALAIGVPVHHPAGHGPLVDTEAEDEPEVETHEADENAGDEEDVHGEEA
jgi:hypothetical protein